MWVLNLIPKSRGVCTLLTEPATCPFAYIFYPTVSETDHLYGERDWEYSNSLELFEKKKWVLLHSCVFETYQHYLTLCVLGGIVDQIGILLTRQSFRRLGPQGLLETCLI